MPERKLKTAAEANSNFFALTAESSFELKRTMPLDLRCGRAGVRTSGGNDYTNDIACDDPASYNIADSADSSGAGRSDQLTIHIAEGH